MINISHADKVRALSRICDVGYSEASSAIDYCEKHPDCNEIGYLFATSCAVNYKAGIEAKIRNWSYGAAHSQGDKENKFYAKWKHFLETGDMSNI